MERFSKIYEKLMVKNGRESFVDTIEKIITQLEPAKKEEYKRNKKHTTRDYTRGIIEVVSNNISWRRYNGKICGKVLNNKHNYYCKLGVYDEIYNRMLGEYLEKTKKETLKILSVDSTFIENKNGTDNLGRNTYYKNKRGRKITTIVDTKGVPITVDISEGNRSDYKLFDKAMHKLKESKLLEKMSGKGVFLADKGYDSEKIRDDVRKMGYDPIIARRKNKRNAESIKKAEIKTYRKRIIVENSFSWLKRYARVDRIYEKKNKSYEGIVKIAISIIIYNKS